MLHNARTTVAYNTILMLFMICRLAGSSFPLSGLSGLVPGLLGCHAVSAILGFSKSDSGTGEGGWLLFIGHSSSGSLSTMTIALAVFAYTRNHGLQHAKRTARRTRDSVSQ